MHLKHRDKNRNLASNLAKMEIIGDLDKSQVSEVVQRKARTEWAQETMHREEALIEQRNTMMRMKRNSGTKEVFCLMHNIKACVYTDRNDPAGKEK